MARYIPTSRFMKGISRIENCANQPPPIRFGEQGDHVYAIQRSLQLYYKPYGMFINDEEYRNKTYGVSTRVFVQMFKGEWDELRDNGRNTPSSNVGVKTIRRLDQCVNDALNEDPVVPDQPKPSTPPPPRQPAKLPGEPRFSDWQVAPFIGVQVAIAGAALSVSVIAFRRAEKPSQQFWYLLPQAGGALGAGLPFTKLAKLVMDIISKLAFNLPSGGSWWNEVKWKYAFNNDDLGGLTCAQRATGVGFIAGYQKTVLSIYGQFWHNEPEYGEASRKQDDLLPPTVLTGYGVGGDIAGMSILGGPLIYLGEGIVNLP